AVVSAVTKSGANTVRGSGYTFFRNDHFDARNYFDGPQKPAFNMNQFGGSLGGPVRREGTFFFNSFAGSGKDLGATSSGTGATHRLRARTVAALAPILAPIPLPTQTTSTGDVGLVQYADNTNITENIYSVRVDGTRSGRDGFYSRYNIQDSLV